MTQPVQKQEPRESLPSPRTTPNRKPPLQVVAGGTGLKQASGIIHEEWHRRLQGIRGVRTYREMRDNSAIVGAMLYAMGSLIKQIPRTTKPAKEDDETSLKAKQHLDECFEDMSHTVEEWLEEILSMLPFGWSNFEIVYKIRRGDSPDPRFRSRFNDGLVGWRKFVIKPQDALTRWELDEEDGGIKGMWVVTDKGEEKFLPITKSALFRIKAHKNNPEGKSLLRNAHLDWYYAKHLTEVEAIGIERHLGGLPKMEVPPELMEPGASADKVSLRTDYENLVTNLRRDELEGIVVPSEEISLSDGTVVKTGYKLSLIASTGTPMDAGPAIIRHEQRMAMSVLMEFLLLGMDKVGSFSLASTKTAIFATALKAIVDLIQAVINRFVIPRLFSFMKSTFPEGTWPTLEFGDIEGPELADISAFVTSLAQAGIIVPDAGIERHLRKIGGLPEREEEEIADEEGIRGELFRYHLEGGIVTINEVREGLGLEPIEGGDELASIGQAFEKVAKALGLRAVDVAKAYGKASSKFDRDYSDLLARDDLGIGDG